MQIDRLSNKIIKKMPKNLSKLEQSRYIYLKLGELFTFDEEYWLGNSSTQKKIYKDSKNGIQNLKSKGKKAKGICISISQTYNQLLKKIGINAVTIQESEEDPHVYSIVKIDDKKYVADLQSDLQYIQTNRKTRFFYNNDRDSQPINFDELTDIDEKLNYTYDGEEYIESSIKSINTKEYENLDQKVKDVFITASKAPGIQNLEYVERTNYYYEFIKRTLTMKEASRVKQIGLKNEEIKKYLSIYSIQNGKNHTRYIYSDKEKKYIEVSDEVILEALDRGYKTVRNKKIPGLEKNNKPQEKTR